MQFQYPIIFYGLFALGIPILVHLFQLRRFQKVDFSNVEFLKAVQLQSRKSSQIKKWLVLITRLAALICLITAFAQPYWSKVGADQTRSWVIYLDNSFSMQAKGKRGNMLKIAVRDLLDNLPDDQQFSLFTNTETYAKVTKKEIQQELLSLTYSANQLSYASAYLKAKQLAANSAASQQYFLMLSDFQKHGNSMEMPFYKKDNLTIDLVQLKAVSLQNLSIDSLYLKHDQKGKLAVHAVINNLSSETQKTILSLYNGSKLLAKSEVQLPVNDSKTVPFALSENHEIKGRFSIEDPTLTFDNNRYFNIDKPKKIKVLAINQSDDRFLKKIYSADNFKLISTPFEAFNYNEIESANLIILNALKRIPNSLIQALDSFIADGGYLCFIPAVDGALDSYQLFFNTLSAKSLTTAVTEKKRITTIRYDHPLYQGVFEKEVHNFQFPTVQKYFNTASNSSILAFEGARPFLYLSNQVYVFTAALHDENSNFKQSPLIVPTFYNMAKQSLQQAAICYTIGKTNRFDVPFQNQSDGVLTLQSKTKSLIPLQQNFPTKVQITTTDRPITAGVYTVTKSDSILQHVSYNYDTSESKMDFHKLKSTSEYRVSDSVRAVFDRIKEASSVHKFWQLFVIFALIFLAIEMLLLKFLK